MSNKIVRVKGGYNYAEAHRDAIQHTAYYEEGLFIDVATRVIDAMETKNVSRAELARRLNVSPAYVTKILRGHANLSLESLAKLAFALDLKWECILIHKNMEIGVFSLTDADGSAHIRTVETATVEGLDSKPRPRTNDEYSEGIRYELRLSA
jgi:transcriptional regulator with XRE-family HTH domain